MYNDHIHEMSLDRQMYNPQRSYTYDESKHTIYNPQRCVTNIYKSPKIPSQKGTKLAAYSSSVSEGRDWMALALANHGSCKNGPLRIEPAG